MAFIDTIRKTSAQIGEITKKTFGPLDPLLEQYIPTTLRYPLDVGNSQRYPHTVEFQTWIPDQVQITDMGVVQAGQDKAVDFYNNIAGSKFGKEVIGLVNKGAKAIGATGFNVPNLPEQVEGYVDPYTSDMMKVDRNQRWNDRMMDFTRRATRSDLIAMYLPQGTWNDRINNSYAQKSLTEAMGNLGGVVDVAGSIMKQVGGENDTVTAWNMVNGPAGAELLGAVAGGLGMDGNVIRDVGLTALGYALNPQFEMLYGGTDLREFQFDFTMTPRSEKEAKMILNIIKKFKYHGSPAYVAGQGRYIVPPSYFDITFKFNGSDSEWLPQISTCVLKSFDVDYTGGLEQWATHADGSPVQVRMVMVFAELEMMHKSLRKKGY